MAAYIELNFLVRLGQIELGQVMLSVTLIIIQFLLHIVQDKINSEGRKYISKTILQLMF